MIYQRSTWSWTNILQNQKMQRHWCIFTSQHGAPFVKSKAPKYSWTEGNFSWRSFNIYQPIFCRDMFPSDSCREVMSWSNTSAPHMVHTVEQVAAESAETNVDGQSQCESARKEESPQPRWFSNRLLFWNPKLQLFSSNCSSDTLWKSTKLINCPSFSVSFEGWSKQIGKGDSALCTAHLTKI